MARKKISPIETLGSDVDNLTVQKSRPLFALWRSELTLPEFKILDTYLSRIDSHNPDRRTVTFSKGELEDLLGVKKINLSTLDERLSHLMTTIRIDDSSSRRGFVRIALFERAVAEQDEYGLWQVQLECTRSAMKYVFNVENLGYLRYKLRCITALKSRQAYVLFMYLEANRFRNPFEVNLDELKQILSCENEESYRQFKRFNDLVLKRIQRELNEKTECRFHYEPIKRGRSVVAVRFTLDSIAAAIPDQIPGQMNIADISGILPPGHELWETAMPDSGFTGEQIEHLRSLIATVPEHKMPDLENIDINRYHYVRNLWTRMLAQRRSVRDRYAYLCRMIEQDVI
jgi:hypothetical protein